MKFQFNELNLAKIEDILKKYPDKKAAVMPVLYLAQEQHGYISGEAIESVAEICGTTSQEVLGVVTFYTMYHQKPVGKFHLQVCTNVSCMLRGGYEIFDAVKDKLDIKNGGLTEDLMFSLEEVECMGSCGTAPMIAVNEDFYENLSKESAIELIETLKRQ